METNLPSRPSVAQRQTEGRAARKTVPRSAHAGWKPPPDRPDPIAILRAQDARRIPRLIPLRYQRMLASPLAFLRGAAAIMAADLARTPATGIPAQLCGDCHLLNFGLYGSPERELLFDVNDFDETLQGPFEWDLKRLATSFVVAARTAGFASAIRQGIACTVVQSYRQHMLAFASMRDLEVWYAHLDADQALRLLAKSEARKRVQQLTTRARRDDDLRALSELTHVVHGQRRIIDDPPVVTRLPSEDTIQWAHATFRSYRQTLQEDRRHIADQYSFVDAAEKVVGIGSVGTRCLIVLLQGRDRLDPLFLQIKEAQASVLGAYLPRSPFRSHGKRVVTGQRLMQAASDIFLGWTRGDDGRDYYVRQLRDMKASVLVEGMPAGEMEQYAALCGWALARAHARSGHPITIAAYLGTGNAFDRAVASFAEAYATQTERDFHELVKAARQGKVPTRSDK
jgi:uncharacterized protein (DUF2252 family)